MKEDEKKGWKKIFSIEISGSNGISDNDNWNLSGKLIESSRRFFLSVGFQFNCISYMVCVRFLCTQSEYILLVFCVVLYQSIDWEGNWKCLDLTWKYRDSIVSKPSNKMSCWNYYALMKYAFGLIFTRNVECNVCVHVQRFGNIGQNGKVHTFKRLNINLSNHWKC